MVSTFDLWAAGCVEAGTELWQLEGEGDTGLYETKTLSVRGGIAWWSTPVYHVWVDGRCVVSTECYHDAVRVWEDR